MPLKLIITEPADIDLLAVWVYVASEFDHDAADRAVASLVQSARLLCTQPTMGREREDVGPGQRAFPAGKHHVIVYFVDGENLVVARFFDARQDPELLFDV